MRLSRRGFLGVAGGGVVALGAGIALSTARGGIGRLLRSEIPLPAPFTMPLRVPDVLAPRVEDGADVYDIVQRCTTQEILPGVETPIWGYHGTFPGPTIVSRRGRRTIVRHHNELPVPTATHLHGGLTPAASDGYPTDLLLPQGNPAPGVDDPAAIITTGRRTYDYPPQPRAATLWYHDHRMGFTGASIWRGLAGFHLVTDDSDEVLPGGEHDLPLMIADRAFAADGSLRYPALDPTLLHQPGVQPEYMQGVLGDVILVNGIAWPFHDVGTARYRLRILNASNARRYRLAWDPPGAGFVQIGSDGGLLETPLAHDEIELAPAERLDVIADFSRYPVGQRVLLRNTLSSGGTGLVMRFHVVRAEKDGTRIPATLGHVEELRPEQAEVTRTFSFRAANADSPALINGLPFDPRRIDARPAPQSVELWQLTTDFHHPIHLHQAHFQVLSRGDNGPGPYDHGWKDTVDLRPSQEAAILVRFAGYPGRLVAHCHNLEHEDMAMMANLHIGQ